jgi:hypothetical protein
MINFQSRFIFLSLFLWLARTQDNVDVTGGEKRGEMIARNGIEMFPMLVFVLIMGTLRGL